MFFNDDKIKTCNLNLQMGGTPDGSAEAGAEAGPADIPPSDIINRIFGTNMVDRYSELFTQEENLGETLPNIIPIKSVLLDNMNTNAEDILNLECTKFDEELDKLIEGGASIKTLNDLLDILEEYQQYIEDIKKDKKDILTATYIESRDDSTLIEGYKIYLNSEYLYNEIEHFGEQLMFLHLKPTHTEIPIIRDRKQEAINLFARIKQNISILTNEIEDFFKQEVFKSKEGFTNIIKTAKFQYNTLDQSLRYDYTDTLEEFLLKLKKKERSMKLVPSETKRTTRSGIPKINVIEGDNLQKYIDSENILPMNYGCESSVCSVFRILYKRIISIDEHFDSLFNKNTTIDNILLNVYSVYNSTLKDLEHITNHQSRDQFKSYEDIFLSFKKYVTTYSKNSYFKLATGPNSTYNINIRNREGTLLTINPIIENLFRIQKKILNRTSQIRLLQTEMSCNIESTDENDNAFFLINEYNKKIKMILQSYTEKILCSKEDHTKYFAFVRSNYLLGYTSILYNIYSLLFLGRCRQIITYTNKSILPSAGVQSKEPRYVSEIADNMGFRLPFILKRQGDWGQVVSSKGGMLPNGHIHPGFIFITFDRLAFMFATLCNVSSILQTRRPNESTPHHYQYTCFKRDDDIFKRKNISTTEHGQLLADCDYLFEGPAYEAVYGKFNEQKSINKEEFNRLLYVTMGILDSWHDWKDGRGPIGEKYKFEFNTLLACLNIERTLQMNMNTLYNILMRQDKNVLKSEEHNKMVPPPLNFEDNITKNWIDMIAQYPTPDGKPNKYWEIFDHNIVKLTYTEISDNGEINIKPEHKITPLLSQYERYPNYNIYIQLFGNAIHQFYSSNHKGVEFNPRNHQYYLIDSTSTAIVFKYLDEVTSSLRRSPRTYFMKNVYTDYDASNSRYVNTNQNDIPDLRNIVYSFNYCGHPQSGSKPLPRYETEKNMSIHRILGQTTNKTKTACEAKHIIENVGDQNILSYFDKNEFKIYKYALYYIYGNSDSETRNRYYEPKLNDEISSLERDYKHINRDKALNLGFRHTNINIIRRVLF